MHDATTISDSTVRSLTTTPAVPMLNADGGGITEGSPIQPPKPPCEIGKLRC